MEKCEIIDVGRWEDGTDSLGFLEIKIGRLVWVAIDIFFCPATGKRHFDPQENTYERPSYRCHKLLHGTYANESLWPSDSLTDGEKKRINFHCVEETIADALQDLWEARFND